MTQPRALIAAIGSILAVAMIALVWDTGAVSADGGPHGGYTTTGATVGGGLPDQCAACHRVHQGQSTSKLLKAASPYELCLTCHNGEGSVLDVFDGIRLGATIPIAGTQRTDATGVLTLSAAPVASVSIPAGEVAEYTMAIRNAGGAGGTVNLSFGTATGTPASFGAAYFDNVPGRAATTVVLGVAPATSYVNVSVPANAGAVVGTSILLPVNASLAGDLPQAILGARVQDPVADPFSTIGSSNLNGGGFTFQNGLAVTARHNADPADNSLAPWGFDPTGGTSNTGLEINTLSSPLQCTSCHNPHGSSNYRILKEKLNTVDVDVKVWFAGGFSNQEGGRGLEGVAGTEAQVGGGTADFPTDKYVTEWYGSSGTGGTGTPAVGGGVSSLCGACHTAYPSTGASSPYVGGGVTHYRHKTEMPYTDWTNPDLGTPVGHNPETSPLFDGVANFPALRLASNAGQSNTVVQCLTCHRVHGTSTTMNGYALKSDTPDIIGPDGVTTFGATGAELDQLLGAGWIARGDPDLTPSQKAEADGTLSLSTLLFTDNRGMCQACHGWGLATP